jgi:hypothetical protein
MWKNVAADEEDCCCAVGWRGQCRFCAHPEKEGYVLFFLQGMSLIDHTELRTEGLIAL